MSESMLMRIFNALGDTSIKNLCYPFPPSTKMSLPTKMSPSPTPSPKPLSFLAPPPIHSKSASRSAYQNSKRNTITQTPTPKASKKSNPKTSNHKTPKQTHQKDNPKQSIKLHQLENTPTQTAIQIHPESAQTPLKTHTPQNARTFSPKRRRVCFQTQRRFT